MFEDYTYMGTFLMVLRFLPKFSKLRKRFSRTLYLTMSFRVRSAHIPLCPTKTSVSIDRLRMSIIVFRKEEMSTTLAICLALVVTNGVTWGQEL